MRGRWRHVRHPTLAAALALTALAPAAAHAKTQWLCGVGVRHDPCRASLTTTAVTARGAWHVVRLHPARSPKIDCFYVYPTVSGQRTTNAMLVADPAVRATARAQASRFSQVCRVWAPLYRQVTLAGLFRFPQVYAAINIAYSDVRAAWRDYTAHHNHGRGVVLIGHSQGAGLLRRLMREQIDPRPSVRRRVVSAILLGGNVKVAAGRTSGGDFKHIPACRSPRQTRCVIAYSSFSQPPPSNTLFGRVGSGPDLLFGGPLNRGLAVLCTNPALLTGGSGALHPAFMTGSARGLLGSLPSVPGVKTAWVSFPGLYVARCHSVGGTSWLQITDIGGVRDQRPRVMETLGPAWGLHIGDVNIAVDDLVSITGQQAQRYAQHNRR